MGVRQVPSGLNPALDGFLRDLRQAVEGGVPQSVRTEIISAAASKAVSTINNGGLDTGPNGPIQSILDGVFGTIANDPNWQHLADQIDVINGPASLPDSMRGQLASTRGQLQAALDQQGSSITTLQTITSDQATQITTLQTNVNGNSSAIITLNQTTATQATQINALGTRMGSAESTIVTLNATTANTAAQVSTLNTTVNGQSASIQTLSQTTSDINNRMSAQWTVKTDVNGRVAGIGLFNDGITSSFYVRVDRFAVGDDTSGAKPCFAVQNGNVYIQQALIGAAYIDTVRIGGNAVTTMAFASSGGGYTSGYIYLPNGAQGLFFLGVAGVSETTGVHPVQANFQLKFNGGVMADGGNAINAGWGQGIVQDAWLGGVSPGAWGFEALTYNGGGGGNLYQWNVSVVCIALLR